MELHQPRVASVPLFQKLHADNDAHTSNDRKCEASGHDGDAAQARYFGNALQERFDRYGSGGGIQRLRQGFQKVSRVDGQGASDGIQRFERLAAAAGQRGGSDLTKEKLGSSLRFVVSVLDAFIRPAR
jgi:hypothetical protein